MSATVKLVNNTQSDVIFGLSSAPHDHLATQKVNRNGGTENVEIDHPDARVIGVWTDSNDLYPSNDAPFTTGGFFADGRSYTVTLNSGGITIS